jgi:predicted transcriptional regulator
MRMFEDGRPYRVSGNAWDALTPEQQAESRRVWDVALADPAFVAALDEGMADLAAGRVVPWEDVKARLKP